MCKIVLNTSSRLAKERCYKQFASCFVKHWAYKASLAAIEPHSKVILTSRNALLHIR